MKKWLKSLLYIQEKDICGKKSNDNDLRQENSRVKTKTLQEKDKETKDSYSDIYYYMELDNNDFI